MYRNTLPGRIAVALSAMAFAGAAFATPGANSTLTVDATLVSGCEVSTASTIHFGDITALASSGDTSAGSGSSFQVACSDSATPTIYATGTRSMANGLNLLPFKLSLTSGAASDDLPSVSGSAATFTLTQDGSLHDVPLYAKVLAADFKGLPSGAYTGNVTVTVLY